MTRKMKDSGIEWIGEIPEDWEITKLKNVLFDKVEKNDSDNPIVLSLARAGIKVRDISNNEGQLAESYLNYNKVSYGDLLLNPMDLISGANCNISEVEGVISPAYFNLNPIDNNNIYYYGYYFKLQYWNMVLFAHGKGVSFENRWTLNRETLLNYYLPVPPISKQKAITNFLDKKTQEIDNIISKTKKAIEEYKKYKQSLITETVTKGLDENVPMKDSGIEWIGEIPEHWEIRKGKRVLKLLERQVFKSDEVITCFRDGEVTLRKNRREDGFTVSLKEIGYQGIEPGDLVVHGMDGFAGAIGISDSRGKGSPVLNVLDSKEDKTFFKYYLRTLANSGVFLALSTGIRERSTDLRWNKLANLEFIVPPKPKQKSIASYLDQKCSQIDQIISTKEKLLKEMEAYKKSLIYETVTGKREVE